MSTGNLNSSHSLTLVFKGLFIFHVRLVRSRLCISSGFATTCTPHSDDSDTEHTWLLTEALDPALSANSLLAFWSCCSQYIRRSAVPAERTCSPFRVLQLDMLRSFIYCDTDWFGIVLASLTIEIEHKPSQVQDPSYSQCVIWLIPSNRKGKYQLKVGPERVPQVE